MRHSFLKNLYLINLFFIIKCNEDLNEYAKKYVLDSKGNFYQDSIKIQKNETKIKSIAYEDKLILYDYKKQKQIAHSLIQILLKIANQIIQAIMRIFVAF